MGAQSYSDFLAAKRVHDPATGIVGDISLADSLFPHQRDIARWAARRGRAAIFAGTGLGKTIMELSWSDLVAAYTGKPILIFTPLAVALQHVSEAEKFGFKARFVNDQSECGPGINITNYQKIDRFDLSAFGGVVLDESSILKSKDGRYRTKLITDCASVPFRLAASATPAPNDFMELGNHAEFLGVMSYTDMLSTFFVHDGGETQKWRLKGHAESEFWRWIASWAVMLREPADLGYSNDGYDLPPLRYHSHTVPAEYAPNLDTGMLFPMEAQTMKERLTARRASINDRVALAASVTPADRPFVWWCNLNDESAALAKAIPGAVETRGSDTDDVKERKLADFSEGRTRVLVTKPLVAGFGLNWQHCADTGFVGLNDSYEQIYQAVRRFWRFGQPSPVNVHFIASEIEGAVVANIRRKERDADHMARQMVAHMADLNAETIRGAERTRDTYSPTEAMTLPTWMQGEPA